MWWVIDKKIGGCAKPTKDEIGSYQSDGIGGIVSLLDDEENLKLYEESGLAHLWLPVKGGTAPTLSQMLQLKEFVDQYTNDGAKYVLVHCTNGNRRTGTILIAYLILLGHSYAEAKSIILKANPLVDLREAQESFLQSLSSQLQQQA